MERDAAAFDAGNQLNPEKKDPKTSDKRRGFLPMWLRRRQAPVLLDIEMQEKKELEDDDDEEDSSLSPEKKKVFRKSRKLLRNLFKKHVDSEHFVAPTTPEKLELEPVAEQPSEEFQGLLRIDHAEAAPQEASTTEVQEPTAASEADPLSIFAEAEPNISHDSPQETAAPAENYKPETLTPESVLETQFIPEQAKAQEALIIPEHVTQTTERIVMPLPYESPKRRREVRELRRQVRNLGDTARDLKKTVEKQSTKLRRAPRSQYARPVIPVLSAPNRAPENSSIVFNGKNYELDNQGIKPTPETMNNSAPKPPQSIENLVERHYEAVSPQNVQRAVEAAVEKNIPIEKYYERRQEIKDEAGQAAYASGAGASFAANAPSVPSQQSIQSIQDSLRKSQQLTQDMSKQLQFYPPNNDVYKQAVRNGFLGAMVIVVFMAIAYALR